MRDPRRGGAVRQAGSFLKFFLAGRKCRADRSALPFQLGSPTLRRRIQCLGHNISVSPMRLIVVSSTDVIES
jgi:hypothetical protein